MLPAAQRFMGGACLFGFLTLLLFFSYYFVLLSLLLFICLLLAYYTIPKCKLDVGSASMLHGDLFGSGEPYPSFAINVVIHFNNGCPTYDEMLISGNKLLKYKRFRSNYIKGKHGYHGEFKELKEPKLEDHVFEHICPTDEHEALMEKIINKHLSMDKPLWECHIICNEKREAGKAVLRMHHGVADGIRAATSFMPLFFSDKKGNPAKLPQFKPRPRKNKPGIFSKLGSLLTAFKMLGDGDICDSKSSFSKPGEFKYTEDYRHTTGGPIDLGLIKKIKTKENCSVNDVLLTAVSRAVRKYCLKRGDVLTKDTRMRCALAFGLPSDDDTILKNNFTLVSSHIGVGEETREKTMGVIQNSMQKVKKSAIAPLTMLIQNIIVYFGLEKAFAPEFKKNFTANSFVYSNVPGIQQPLYCFGHEVTGLSCFFCNAVPQMILLSYNNQISMGLTTQRDVVEDPVEFANSWVKEISQWASELGIKEEPKSEAKVMAASPAPAIAY